MSEPTPPTPPPPHPHFHREGGQVVGKPVPLLDAKSKVTGEAIYTDDLKLPGMLVGKILRSPLPHARIVRIDTARAEALPGVRAIVTGQESSGHFGVLPISEDETAMAIDKVRYIGDCVAGVAAEDEAMEFIERRRLMGRGIGYIDVHLLASVALAGTATLWTRDRRLATVADDLALTFEGAIRV